MIRGGFAIATIRQGIGFLDGIWNANAGRSLTTSANPSTTPSIFAPGSVLFGDASFPALVPSSIDPSFPNPSFPLAVQSGQNVEDYNPSIKPEYVESWTLGFQRQISRNTVVEARYVGNHGVDLWQTVNLNEVNTVENGFATQFQAAQNNLAIANGFSVGQLLASAQSGTGIKLTSNNYGNQGLPGQVNVPLLTTAIGSSTDQTTVTQLTQGQAGATANAIATNATRMANLTKAGSPINLFQVNPNNGGNSTELTNRNSSTYNSAQIRSAAPPCHRPSDTGQLRIFQVADRRQHAHAAELGRQQRSDYVRYSQRHQDDLDLPASVRPGPRFSPQLSRRGRQSGRRVGNRRSGTHCRAARLLTLRAAATRSTKMMAAWCCTISQPSNCRTTWA